MIRIRSILLSALLVLIGGVPAKAAETPVKTIAITNVRIFDGTRVIPQRHRRAARARTSSPSARRSPCRPEPR